MMPRRIFCYTVSCNFRLLHLNNLHFQLIILSFLERDIILFQIYHALSLNFHWEDLKDPMIPKPFCSPVYLIGPDSSSLIGFVSLSLTLSGTVSFWARLAQAFSSLSIRAFKSTSFSHCFLVASRDCFSSLTSFACQFIRCSTRSFELASSWHFLVVSARDFLSCLISSL